MEEKLKFVFIIVASSLFIALTLWIFSDIIKRNITGSVIQNPLSDELASCLNQKGAIMYGTNSCSYCKNQKDMFGSSFSKINFVDCDKNKNECLVNGVQGYPTWKINGGNYPGVQSLEKLSELSGCKFS